MTQSFSPYEYLGYVRSRWRFLAVACGAALAVALAVSLVLPRKYTATARILIDPPAGSDQRAATAVSPVYLESLRTYEAFASSDELFSRAAGRFELRRYGQPIEQLKRSVLRVGIERNTRILEVSATLRDPRQAYALANYIAGETIQLNRSVNREGDRDLGSEAAAQAAEARARLERARQEWNRIAAAEPVDALTQQLRGAEELRARLEQERLNLDLNVEEYNDRAQSATRPGEAESARSELRYARLRRQGLDRQLETLGREIARLQAQVAARSGDREARETELKAAQAALATAENHLRQVRGEAGYRGERLKLIDSGVVPERPSSPNLPLNVAIALFAALVLAIGYVSFEFGSGAPARPARVPLRIAGHD